MSSRLGDVLPSKEGTVTQDHESVLTYLLHATTLDSYKRLQAFRRLRRDRPRLSVSKAGLETLRREAHSKFWAELYKVYGMKLSRALLALVEPTVPDPERVRIRHTLGMPINFPDTRSERHQIHCWRAVYNTSAKASLCAISSAHLALLDVSEPKHHEALLRHHRLLPQDLRTRVWEAMFPRLSTRELGRALVLEAPGAWHALRTRNPNVALTLLCTFAEAPEEELDWWRTRLPTESLLSGLEARRGDELRGALRLLTDRRIPARRLLAVYEDALRRHPPAADRGRWQRWLQAQGIRTSPAPPTQTPPRKRRPAPLRGHRPTESVLAHLDSHEDPESLWAETPFWEDANRYHPMGPQDAAWLDGILSADLQQTTLYVHMFERHALEPLQELLQGHPSPTTLVITSEDVELAPLLEALSNLERLEIQSPFDDGPRWSPEHAEAIATRAPRHVLLTVMRRCTHDSIHWNLTSDQAAEVAQALGAHEIVWG